MGIAKGAVAFLFELKKTTKFKGVICQLGKQTTYVTEGQFCDLGKSFGFTIDSSMFKYQDKALKQEMISDIDLFTGLGFDEVRSIDYSDFEDADYVLDLNKPIPEYLHNKFDAIYDGGTLEHVFNFPQSLKNIHNMLKPGGVIMHASPSHNHVDHGFYMFSPTVYHDYYSANGYDVLRANIFEYEAAHDKCKWIVYKYTPGMLDPISHGGWGKKLLGIWFVAKKTSNATCDVVPQQSFYRRAWERAKGAEQVEETKDPKQKVAFAGIKKVIQSVPVLQKKVARILKFIKKNGRPPIIARY